MYVGLRPTITIYLKMRLPNFIGIVYFYGVQRVGKRIFMYL